MKEGEGNMRKHTGKCVVEDVSLEEMERAWGGHVFECPVWPCDAESNPEFENAAI